MKDESNTAELPSQPEDQYKGPDRRRHRVYVTRNTEYHFRDGFCVAVRDRKSGEFLHGHLALQRRVDGGLKFFENGGIAPNPGDPKPGESLYFATHGPDLVTSPLVGVERPSKAVSQAYPGSGKAKGSPGIDG